MKNKEALPRWHRREGCDWGPNRQFRNGRRRRKAVNQRVELLTTLPIWAENPRERGKRRLRVQGCACTPVVPISNRERRWRRRKTRTRSRPAACGRDHELEGAVNRSGTKTFENKEFGSPPWTRFELPKLNLH